jgi:hypothetical protein
VYNLCPAVAGIAGLTNLTSLQLRIASMSTLQQLPLFDHHRHDK